MSDEYETYLEKSISEAIGSDVKVTLINDGQAAAVCFSEENNSTLIALGTAFGVGYPEYIPGLNNASSVEITS